MKNSKRILFVLALALILVMSVVFVACNDNKATPSETLIVGTKMTIESLNRLHALGGEPGYNFSMISAAVSQVTPIAKMDGKFVPVACDFATSNDGAKVTLTLKNGFKWHDGKDLTIEDLEYTFMEGYSKLNKGADYDSVEKIGNSLVFAISTQENKFLETVASKIILAKHLLQGETKETLTDEKSVIGAGPFKFVERNVEANTVTFEKFADYPQADKVQFNKVIFKVYEQEDVLARALKAGEIDMIYNYGGGLGKAVATSLQGLDNVTLYADTNTRAIPKSLFFNNQKMTDARVKRAIALSIDFDKIRATFGSASSLPSREGIVAPSIFGYKETPVWQRDLEKAKALLKDAGYSTTNKFKFQLLINSDANSPDTQYANLLKPQIEESGMVTVEVQGKSKADYQATYKKGEHMADLVGITDAGYGFEAGYATRYTLAAETSMMPDKKNPACHGQMLVEDADKNLTEYGKILKKMIGAKTADELKAAVGEYQDFMVENVVFVPMFYDAYTQAYSSRLDGFKLDAKLGLLNPVVFETLKKSK